ncbi:MAG: hypothetical protein Q8K36_05530, partial [Alphaproteobacteria bacterium]|nr:hypothetical protein [Alphaproteobacteria bacterium]
SNETYASLLGCNFFDYVLPPPNDNRAAVIITAGHAGTQTPVVFSDVPSLRSGTKKIPGNPKIKEMILASSAAPHFFGKHHYAPDCDLIDGGVLGGLNFPGHKAASLALQDKSLNDIEVFAFSPGSEVRQKEGATEISRTLQYLLSVLHQNEMQEIENLVKKVSEYHNRQATFFGYVSPAFRGEMPMDGVGFKFRHDCVQYALGSISEPFLVILHKLSNKREGIDAGILSRAVEATIRKMTGVNRSTLNLLLRDESSLSAIERTELDFYLAHLKRLYEIGDAELLNGLLPVIEDVAAAGYSSPTYACEKSITTSEWSLLMSRITKEYDPGTPGSTGYIIARYNKLKSEIEKNKYVDMTKKITPEIVGQLIKIF